MRQGFTLIELLVVIGIIGILAAVVLVAVNPARQFASTRDTQRRSDLYSITNGIYQYMTEHNGLYPPGLPSTPTRVGNDGGLINLTTVLVPTYIAAIPKDPSTGSDGNTNYYIWIDAENHLNASATSELNPTVPITIKR